MHGKSAVVRLYIKPGQKYWAYTPLRNGKHVVLYAALGQPPTFRVVEKLSGKKKRENGYALVCDIKLSDLGEYVGLNDQQHDALMSNAEVYDVLRYDGSIIGWRWERQLGTLKPGPPKVMPNIVVEPSQRYTW